MIHKKLDWCVIGAGPAGIAAVGRLIDEGVAPNQIGWIDPYFTVGDLGRRWYRVPSNTKVDLFLRFIHACKCFDFKSRTQKFQIEAIPFSSTCFLEDVARPLQWITDHLKMKVNHLQGEAISLNLYDGHWEIKTNTISVFSKNVILAIGCDCKSLSLSGPETIPLEVALNPEKLRAAVASHDSIAVFGSSHSAILALANSLALPVKRVVNFYRSPHRYAISMGEWILYDDGGLKGFAADWARENLDGKMPARLERVLTSDPTFDESLNLCNKAIYTVGFQRRKLPVLEQYNKVHYDDRTGIIAPGLFGCGIAFPEAKFNKIGHLEYRVGLWKFMEYLTAAVPLWLKYSN